MPTGWERNNFHFRSVCWASETAHSGLLEPVTALTMKTRRSLILCAAFANPRTQNAPKSGKGSHDQKKSTTPGAARGKGKGMTRTMIVPYGKGNGDVGKCGGGIGGNKQQADFHE